MEYETILQINGGKPLQGEVRVSGGKNASVAIIPAALLAAGTSVLENIPDVSDTRVYVEIMRELGAAVDFENGRMVINASNLTSWQPPRSLTSRMRASYYLLGVLAHRMGKADIPQQGGCSIGARPIDQTIKVLNRLNVQFRESESEAGSTMHVVTDGIHGAEISLDMPSVGATMNALLTAAVADSDSIIHNAAKEPHIVDLSNFLNTMGAKIKGAGTDTIRISGGRALHGANYTVIPDQIETGTLMIAAAITRGHVILRGTIPTHMEMLTAKLLEMGVKVTTSDDAIEVNAEGCNLRGIKVTTQYYPGFPTDLHQPMAALMCTACGESQVNETIFESRFKYIDQLRRMGADIYRRDGEPIVVAHGSPNMKGCDVQATDLRAGAALVVAALGAPGTTNIHNLQYIDRGYEGLAQKLAQLGADIRRIQVPAEPASAY